MLKSGSGGSSVAVDLAASESVRLAALLNSFETVGHLVADLDPLNLQEVYKDIDQYAEKFRFAKGPILNQLDYKHYGFTEADLEREFLIEYDHKSQILQQKKLWKLKDVIEAYRSSYCSKIGVEFTHIPESDICDWIRLNFEGIQFNKMSDKEKIHLYDRLNWSHDFGSFTTQKFNTMKRFGLEGCESFIPGLKVAIDAAIDEGAHHFVIGMPHRGRLNVLANVVRKPMEIIMAEF
jgi:2-oxoglutarate dehydrogenase E1 component